MKILLLGQKGYLGSYIYRNLKTDVLKDKIKKIYPNKKSYDYVINCIGKPDLEFCETHPKETNYSNYLVLKDIKLFYPTSKIINFSSYYVYDSDRICSENSKTTKKYNYTRQKLLAEKEVVSGVTFRLGKLFGNNEMIQNKLTDYIISHDELWLDDVRFNPTSVSQILDVIKYELKHNYLTGIYNLSNDGFTTHYEYGLFINKYLKSDKKIYKVPKFKRNFHNYGKFLMSTKKIRKVLPLRSWKMDLKSYLRELNS